jgi:hypothetical protein
VTTRAAGGRRAFCSRLDQIIDMNHALVKLARTIDWRFLEETSSPPGVAGPT